VLQAERTEICVEEERLRTVAEKIGMGREGKLVFAREGMERNQAVEARLREAEEAIRLRAGVF
jgi:hypothetical protein